MSNFANQIIESVPTHFSEPKWLAVAGAVAIGGALVDKFKQSLDNDLSQTGTPLADPEIAAIARAENTSLINRERLGHYSAVGFLALGAVQLANPYTISTEKTGSVSVVIDSGYRANATDMDQGQTRLQASIDAALKVAGERDVAMSIIMAGNTTRPLTQLAEESKQIGKSRNEITDVLKDPSFRNGESIAEAVIQAQGLNAAGANKTIVLAANPGSTSEQPKIKAIQDKAKSIYSIVTGKGNAEVTIGNAVIKAPADPNAFGLLIGKDNVSIAKSEAEIVKSMNQIIDTNLIRKTSNPNQLPGKLALGFAILGAGVSVLRRAAGLSNGIKRS